VEPNFEKPRDRLPAEYRDRRADTDRIWSVPARLPDSRRTSTGSAHCRCDRSASQSRKRASAGLQGSISRASCHPHLYQHFTDEDGHTRATGLSCRAGRRDLPFGPSPTTSSSLRPASMSATKEKRATARAGTQLPGDPIVCPGADRRQSGRSFCRQRASSVRRGPRIRAIVAPRGALRVLLGRMHKRRVGHRQSSRRRCSHAIAAAPSMPLVACSVASGSIIS
jgi:hypothetical protein